MSRRRFYSDYVRDRLEEIQLIVQFLQDITFDEFIVPILKRPPCVVFFYFNDWKKTQPRCLAA